MESTKDRFAGKFGKFYAAAEKAAMRDIRSGRVTRETVEDPIFEAEIDAYAAHKRGDESGYCFWDGYALSLAEYFALQPENTRREETL